jgi:hypothetical protein
MSCSGALPSAAPQEVAQLFQKPETDFGSIGKPMSMMIRTCTF